MQFEEIRDLGTTVTVFYEESDSALDEDVTFNCDNIIDPRPDSLSSHSMPIKDEYRIDSHSDISQEDNFYLPYLEFIKKEVPEEVKKLCFLARHEGEGENEGCAFELLYMCYRFDSNADSYILGVRDEKDGKFLKALVVGQGFKGMFFNYRNLTYLLESDNISILFYKMEKIICFSINGSDLFEDNSIYIDSLSSPPTIVLLDQNKHLLYRLGDMGGFLSCEYSKYFPTLKNPEILFMKDLSDIRKDPNYLTDSKWGWDWGYTYVFCDKFSRVWLFGETGKLAIFTADFELIYLGIFPALEETHEFVSKIMYGKNRLRLSKK